MRPLAFTGEHQAMRALVDAPCVGDDIFFAHATYILQVADGAMSERMRRPWRS